MFTHSNASTSPLDSLTIQYFIIEYSEKYSHISKLINKLESVQKNFHIFLFTFFAKYFRSLAPSTNFNIEETDSFALVIQSLHKSLSESVEPRYFLTSLSAEWKSLLRRRESHCLGFNFRWKQGDKRCAYNSEPWKKLGKTVASELSLACLLGRLVRFTACLSVFVSFPLSASLSRRKACTQRPASFEDGLSDFASSL